MFFKKTFLKMSQNFKTIRQLIGNIHPWFMTISYLSKLIWTLSIYRIRAYSIPLLIKPSLQPNLNEPLLFCSKSPLFKAFWGKNQKNFNKPPPKNPQIFINRWRTIGADTHTVSDLKKKCIFILSGNFGWKHVGRTLKHFCKFSGEKRRKYFFSLFTL